MDSVQVTNPYNGHALGILPTTSEAEAFEALETAHALYSNRDRWLPKCERLAILERLATLIEGRGEELALQAAREGGKPLVDSRVELQRATAGVRVACRELATEGGHEVPMDLDARSRHRWAMTYRDPRGVVLALSAFNHPFNLIVHQVVPAIAAGCPAIVKPAKATPLSCKSLVELTTEAGLPSGWCTMVLPEHSVVDKLVRDSRVAFLTFIGSSAVGWSLRSKLAPGAHCALEHGGLAPVIVDETADLEQAVPKLVKAGYYHAGQVCVSVQRIYVAKAQMETFVGQFVPAVKALRVGDPIDPSTEVGPLIRGKEVERVHAWVKEAVAGGAKLLCGGESISPTCYAPSVLCDPPDDAALSTKEVFGPVVCLYSYDSKDEALRRANRPHGAYFQASVFTRDLDFALEAGRKLQGVAVMVNDHTAFRVDWMPFGGHRESGLGLGGIGYSMRDMTVERMVVFNSPAL